MPTNQPVNRVIARYIHEYTFNIYLLELKSPASSGIYLTLNFCPNQCGSDKPSKLNLGWEAETDGFNAQNVSIIDTEEK